MPVNVRPLDAATARRWPMVAIEPLSKYLNGPGGLRPAIRALITLPTYLPSCMAGWATPGRPFRATMSPMANTSGGPGGVQAGPTDTPPAPSGVAVVLGAGPTA